MFIPDPQEAPFITGNCGHEIYNGELAFEWEGRVLCEDCYRDKINELSITEIATDRGDDWYTVSICNRRKRYE